jgi:hypothetical protein
MLMRARSRLRATTPMAKKSVCFVEARTKNKLQSVMAEIFIQIIPCEMANSQT